LLLVIAPTVANPTTNIPTVTNPTTIVPTAISTITVIQYQNNVATVNQSITIDGNFTFPQFSITKFGFQGSINITGCAILSGDLEVTAPNKVGKVVITPIEAACFVGNFTVSVDTSKLSPCYIATIPKAEIVQYDLRVLFSVDSSCNSLSVGSIVAIVVVVVVALIATILGLFMRRFRKQIFPFRWDRNSINPIQNTVVLSEQPHGK